jgi:tRNA nucleotidyltransferase (CCA-adding enzyme)
MKGRKAEQMHAPVRAYMTKKTVTISKHATIRDVEHLLYSNNIGHLPVIENGKVTGIITRWDYITFIEKRKDRIMKQEKNRE